MNKLPQHKRKSLFDIGLDAQRIAFAPIAFQNVRLLRDFGILQALSDASLKGMTIEEVAEAVSISIYGARVLLEGGLANHIVHELEPDRYTLTKTGQFILTDEITNINMDFTQYVCYDAMNHLEESIRSGKPSGLKVFGDWPTLYPALTSLPEKARDSWFNFDHYYSDSAFPECLDIVFSKPVPRLLDIGGNTGKWATQCVTHDPAVTVTIADLPQQLKVALENAASNGFENRILGHPLDLLQKESSLPDGHDAIWMSQFLCCFSEDEIMAILAKVKQVSGKNTRLFVMDTFWDRQQTEAASYSLLQSSLYFTCIANGNSRMYRSTTFIECLEQCGFTVQTIHDHIGLSHTILECSLQA